MSNISVSSNKSGVFCDGKKVVIGTCGSLFVASESREYLFKWVILLTDELKLIIDCNSNVLCFYRIIPEAFAIDDWVRDGILL